MNGERKFIYEIKDQSVDDTERFIIEGDINPDEINELIFYLQYEFHKELEEATLIPFDIENILTKYYGFNQVYDLGDSKIDLTIDLIDNVNEYLNEDSIKRVVSKKELFYREGIKEEFKDLVMEIVFSNPGVFNKKFLDLQIIKDNQVYFPVPRRIIEEVQIASKE
ncbi:hypothetical protein ACQPU1_10060 [Clostridium paraputrificum]|uniref:hypothetical protein n=1 Tax=Clostridium TaxID=1485 RepID=UPI003D351F1E